MFCRYCGQEIPNDSMVCTYCGKKLRRNANTRVNDTDDEKAILEDLRALRRSKKVTKKEEPRYSLPPKKKMIKTRYIKDEEDEVEIIDSSTNSFVGLNDEEEAKESFVEEKQSIEEQPQVEETPVEETPVEEETVEEVEQEIEENVEQSENALNQQEEVVPTEVVGENLETLSEEQVESGTQGYSEQSGDYTKVQKQPVEENFQEDLTTTPTNEDVTENTELLVEETPVVDAQVEETQSEEGGKAPVEQSYVTTDYSNQVVDPEDYHEEGFDAFNIDENVNQESQPQEEQSYSEGLSEEQEEQAQENYISDYSSIESAPQGENSAPIVVDDNQVTEYGSSDVYGDKQGQQNGDVDGQNDFNQQNPYNEENQDNLQNQNIENMSAGERLVQQMEGQPQGHNPEDFVDFDRNNESKEKMPKVKKDKSQKSNIFGILSLILTILTGLVMAVALVFKKFRVELQKNDGLYSTMEKVYDLVATNYIVLIILAVLMLVSVIFAVIQLFRKGNLFSWINLVLVLGIYGTIFYGLYSTKTLETMIDTIKGMLKK